MNSVESESGGLSLYHIGDFNHHSKNSKWLKMSIQCLTFIVRLEVENPLLFKSKFMNNDIPVI